MTKTYHGLSDKQEKMGLYIEGVIVYTDPRDADTDDDGYTDEKEFNAQSDPTDLNDKLGGGGFF